MTIRRSTFLFVLALAAVSACGGDDDDDTQATTSDAGDDDGPGAEIPRRGRLPRSMQSADATVSLPPEETPDAGTDDPLASEEQLEMLAAAYDTSVEAECGCFWMREGFDYASEMDCVQASSLDEELSQCHARIFGEARQSEIECKLQTESELQDCVDRQCGDDDELDCIDQWAIDDEACQPELAERFYRECIEGS